MNKNLFELSQEEKNKIRGLHESYKNKPGTKLIWEQSETDELKKFNDRIAEVIQSKQAEILSQVKISLLQEEIGVVIKTNYQSKKYITKKTYGNTYSTGDFNENIYLEAVPLSKYITEIIGSDANFLKLYNEPSIKNQVNQMMIPARIYSEGTGANISINPIKNSRKFRKDPRYHEDEATWNTEMGVGSNIYLFPINNKTIAAVQLGGLAIQLGNVALERTEPVTPTPPPVANSFEFVLEDNFIFNTITLTPEGVRKYNEKKSELGSFLKKISRLQTTPGNTTVSDILNTDVKIYGYASIDGDPNEDVTNGREIYEPCRGSGNGSRKDYNMCLSRKRAEYIANDLNNFIGEITLPDGDTILSRFGEKTVKNWAVGIGEGETSEFSGKKWPETKGDTKATAPDRRVVFTPKLVANIKG